MKKSVLPLAGVERSLGMTIEDFGARVVSVWEGLRPATRSLVERALVSMVSPLPTTLHQATRSGGGASYDARAEWELSRLLVALDDRASEPGAATLSDEQSKELGRMIETCARVLYNQARSAEVFAQLLGRALRVHDYRHVDALADTLLTRLAPSEVCELARHRDAAVRAIAQEALLQTPTSLLVELLSDPVDAEIAREALERQAIEFESEEARWVVSALERADAAEEDM